MTKHNQRKSANKKLLIRFKLFFRNHPRIPYIIKWFSICLIIGVSIGSASAGFLVSLDWATNVRENNLWLIAVLPIGGLSIGFLYHNFGRDIESGNNLLISTIHNPKQRIPFKMAPFAYIGTIITHLFGGSAGREGTALQMAGATAYLLTKPFKLHENDRKTLLIAAIAAGFGSVFGTPLAGAIFAFEVSLFVRIKYNAILPAFLSAIIANLVTKLWQVNHTHYHIDIIPDLEFLSIFYSLIAGIAFGLCAASFTTLMHFVSKVFKEKIKFPPMRPFVGGILVSLLILALGTTKYIGLGIPTILESFNYQLPLYDFAIKMTLSILTLSAGFKGGEVTPLFFIGATLGSALSLFVPLPTGLLAGMGFVAVFAGATNTPLACIMMGIELFGAECGIFMAVACIASYLFSGSNSIYSKPVIGQEKKSPFRGKR